MAITLADFNKIWASTSPLTPYSFSESNYKQGWNFIGSTPPARQMWDYLQKNNDEKMKYLANNYLPLSGGTMSGQIKLSGGGVDKRVCNVDTSSMTSFCGGTTYNTGAIIWLAGKDNSGAPGVFQIDAHDGTTYKRLEGKPDGTLTWDGSNVITAAGGTMTGAIETSYYIGMRKSTDTSYIDIYGSTNWNKGGGLGLYGKDSTNARAGGFSLWGHDGTTMKALQGKPDGTLTWDGQPIQTSSDKRLKQDFADVPDDVLEAWGKVNWQQFKYIADVERKGDSCRFHTGLVAQDVKEVGEENNVDLLKYGILCHDVREAVEEEKDENGNIIKEASEAVDLWTIRYEEALCMEAAYQRRRADRLEDRIEALEKLLMNRTE